MDVRGLIFELMMADTDEHEHILITKEVRDEIIDMVVELYKESKKQKVKEGYVAVPFSWLVKFCTHIDFNEPMLDVERARKWRDKLCQQFGIQPEFMKFEDGE